MNIKIIAMAFCAAVAATAFGGGSKGSCISKAKSLGSSQTATLVAEYDPEEKETYENGVAYYKMTLSRGQAYTVWITGGNVADIDLDCYTDDEYYWDRDNEPSAGFDVDEIDGGATKFAYLYADDWDLEEDPSSGRYIVELDGEIGESTTLNFVKGIKAFTKVGTEDSPKVLSFKTSWKTYSSKMVDGEYYISASLKAGRKYRVYLTGGKSTAPLTMSVEAMSDDMDEPSVIPDPQHSTASNDAYIVVPETSGKHVFVASGDTSQFFAFHYELVPTRAIGSHVSIPLIPENGYKACFVPGRIADNQNYYDDIIDERLCRIRLVKGQRWMFETSGATNSIRMVVYDSAGKTLASNETSDGEDFDTRVVVTASATGIYYVGVCDPILDVGDAPTGAPVELTARDVSGLPYPDPWDPVDDTYGGATFLTAVPSGTNQTVDAEAFVSAEHSFGANDFYDCYAIECRKGNTYMIETRYSDPDTVVSRFTLASKVFYLSSGKEKPVTTTGSVTPPLFMHEGVLTFKAPISGVIYVRVWVADGKGLDFPSYDVVARVVNGDTRFGLLAVEERGAEGTFSLNSETVKYPSAGTITLNENANLKVVFNAPTGFKADPASVTLAIPACEDGAGAVKAAVKYTDVYDAKYQTGTKTVTKNGKTTTTKLYSPADGDATPAGAFAITPAASPATYRRTLWADDPADHFKFTAAANVYYNFSLSDTTKGGVCGAKLVVSNSVSGVVAEGVEIEKALLPAGVTYLVVTHDGTSAEGGSYELTCSKASVGLVKFKSASFTATEGSEFATLTLSRTGKEGAVRAKYWTVAGTAQPGEEYVPVTEGVVSWANGDKADKTVKIRLIPDLNAAWAASNLYFNVQLGQVDEYDLATGEYLALFGQATAKVTIKEATAAKPGKISLAAYGDGSPADVRVTKTTAPVAHGVASALKADGGTPLVLTFERTGGSDGQVSVKVATSAPKTDTAKKATDYAALSQTLTWADGDAEPKQVTLMLYKRSATDFTVARKFTLSMAAVKGKFTPALAAKTASVSIDNDTAAQAASTYAKSIPASTGVKLAATGSWFKDTEGVYRSASVAGTTTFTLTGPGLFVCEPGVVSNGMEGASAKLTCQFGKEAAAVVGEGERIVRIVGAGSTAVKFTLSGVAGGAYASFKPQADGLPYAFTQFKTTKPANPLNGSVIVTNATSLAWTLAPALLEEEGMYVRTRFGTNSKSLPAISWTSAHESDAPLAEDALASGKTYYWTVDYARSDATGLTEEDIKSLKWTAGPTVWKFTTIKAGAPITTVEDGEDAAGEPIANLIEEGRPVELIQCVRPNLELMGMGDAGMAANKFRLAGGSLPKGITINATTGRLSGCPTAVGTTTALLQGYNVTTVSKKVNGKTKKVTTTTYGTTIPVTFNVLPAGTALGSWRGPIVEDGSTFGTDSRHVGTFTLSATSAGKITAKAVIAGVTYTFTGTTGYAEIVDRYDDPAMGDVRRLRVELSSAMTIAKKSRKNYLTVEIDDVSTTNSVALGAAKASVELNLQVANAKKTAVTPDIAYKGEPVRNHGGSAVGKVAIADFAGYYTIGLAPMEVAAADGVPFGNGYLTFTVGTDSSVKVAGVLADGTSVSQTTFGQLVGDDLAEPRKCVLRIPVSASTSTYALQGYVTLAYEDAESGLPVALGAERLSWIHNASTVLTRDGSGFALEVAPTGGWYDKVVNLQAHYLDRGFSILAVEDPGDLPIEALASGYAFSTSAAVQEFLATPENLQLWFVGNAAKVNARKLVKNATTGLYDFTASVNPWNATVKFTRATGIMTGTFSAWEWVFKSDDIQDFAAKQKEIAKLTHKGVWLYSRESAPDSSLRDDAVTAGFFLMPTSGKWKASLPFTVIAEPVVNDWSENGEDL